MQLLVTKLNLLLLFIPVALVLQYLLRPILDKDELVDGIVFVCSILVLCPLAEVCISDPKLDLVLKSCWYPLCHARAQHGFFCGNSG